MCGEIEKELKQLAHSTRNHVKTSEVICNKLPHFFSLDVSVHAALLKSEQVNFLQRIIQLYWTFFAYAGSELLTVLPKLQMKTHIYLR